MSKVFTNEWNFQIEDLIAHKDLIMSGHVLDYDDRLRVANAYVSLALVLVDTVDLVDDEYRESLRRTYSSKNVANYFLRSWVHTDVALFMEQQKCALQVIRHIPVKGCSDYEYKLLCSEFGYDRGLDCNSYLNYLLRALCLNPSAKLFKAVNTILQFASRLTLRGVDWIEEENIQAYKDFESNLKDQNKLLVNLSLDDWDDFSYPIVSEMHSIVTEWFRDFTYEEIAGLHGYGATAQVRRSAGTTAKYKAMKFSGNTARTALSLNWLPLDHIWSGLSKDINRCLTTNSKQEWEPIERITRVQLVPKGINKKRVVSMEDTTNQFFQKMMQSLLSSHFEKHPEMHIHLHNQELNRRLCRASSRNRNYGTIDLSSASDSVTWSLVRYVFRDTPIFKDILRLRTKTCELPDGTRLTMEKAFPMGSALCFPIECIIFSSLIEAANRHLGVHTYYCVYGDDMIVESRIWDLVISYLKRLNFIVNDTKSFEPSYPFKESCGDESFNGQDVAPVRLSRKWDYAGMVRSKKNLPSYRPASTAMLTSLYDLGNQCFDAGYSRLRKYVIEICFKYYLKPVFSRNRLIGFISNSTTLNDHLTIKRSSGRGSSPRCDSPAYYVTYQVRGCVEPGSDEMRYSKLIETYSTTSRTSLRIFADRIEATCGAARTRIKKVLVPVSFTEEDDRTLELIQSYRERHPS